MEQLFVYGTLRPHRAGVDEQDTRNYGHIAKLVTAQEPATVAGKLHDYGQFPGALPGEGTVQGELLTVSDLALQRCDALEGHPRFFHRERVKVQTATGEQEAWIYWAPARFASRDVIASGDWFDR